MPGWNKMKSFLFSSAEKFLKINSKLEMKIWSFLLVPITALSHDIKHLRGMTEWHCYFIHNKCQNFNVNFHFLCAGGFEVYKVWLILAVITFIEHWLGSRPCLGFVPMFSSKSRNHTMRQVFLIIKLHMGSAACPRSPDRFMARWKS